MKKIFIKPADIAKLFNDNLSDYVKNKILEYKLIYSPLEKEDVEQVTTKCLKK